MGSLCVVLFCPVPSDVTFYDLFGFSVDGCELNVYVTTLSDV